LQLALNRHDIEQGGSLGGINEKIKISAIGTLAMQHGTKHAWIDYAMTQHNLPDEFFVCPIGQGGSHCQSPTKTPKEGRDGQFRKEKKAFMVCSFVLADAGKKSALAG
jgi:hypothetical protein